MLKLTSKEIKQSFRSKRQKTVDTNKAFLKIIFQIEKMTTKKMFKNLLFKKVN